MKSGIYIITNTANNKAYIGSSKDIENRWYKHRWLLLRHKHNNLHLQSAWNTYGEQAFVYKVLERCGIENLVEREDWWIRLVDSVNPEKGYNMISANRREWSSASREKLSINASSRRPEVAAKISLANTGKKQSPETVIKRIEKLKGKGAKTWEVVSPEMVSMIICNLRQFSIDNNLEYRNMHAVSKGKANYHRGWKVRAYNE